MEEIKNLANDINTKFDANANALLSVKSELSTMVEKSIDSVKAEIKAVKDEMDKQAEEVSRKSAAKIASTKSIGEQIAENLDSNMAIAEKELKSSGGSFTMNLKAVGNMLLSSNLTGDSVATYNQQQAILPSQKLNFRDLVSTVQSATGTFVTYKESGSEGAITSQTEGASKGQIDYDLTEVKTVNAYIAGFATFSKQMMKSLPFIEQTLTRMMLRDFFKAENAAFFSTVSGAATGSTTVTATDDVEEIIQLIGNQKTANFNASYALVSPAQMARLIINTYNKGYYAGAGAVILNGAGGLTIFGTPVFEASWVTDDKVLIFDRDYLERVEVEGLNVTFSYENGSNFVQNLVTARIECYEAINLMLPTAAIYADLGNA
jgi:phage host-nuclease inhibitor protein Gam